MHAVRGISFDIEPEQTLALVGESGSGKSVTALSVLRLLPGSATVGGKVLFKGQDLAAASDREMRRVRGADISMIFQEPMSSLNPLHTIEQQVSEVLITPSGSAQDGGARPQPSSCSRRSASPMPKRGSTPIRTSFRAGSGSG